MSIGGISYQEAEEKINEYESNFPAPRGDLYREERVVLEQIKTIQSGYDLTCTVTAYALRDYLSGAYVEFIRVSSANISMEGDHVDSAEWVGGDSSVSPWLASTSRLNVDYNGHVEFKVDASLSVGFAVFSFSIGDDWKVYEYDCNGQFVFWALILFALYLIDEFFDHSRALWPAAYAHDGNQRSEAMQLYLDLTRYYYWVKLILSPIARGFLLWHGLDCIWRILKFCQPSDNAP